ncbi:MAG TPA: NADH-quinone oxidoreductase subunit M [Flavobacteriaceae bacterium]|nr:NADH-quinone oxidoreductase subunit M [Flavobacteriaceae bacterium]
MMLAELIIILMLGGVIAWLAGKWSTVVSKWIALIAVLIDSIIFILFLAQHPEVLNQLGDKEDWLIDFHRDWIPQIGASFHLALDGLSLIMVALTLFLGVVAVLASWKEIKSRVGFHYFNILWLLAGILGVFLAMDLLLFYFFWEIMLIPMFFLLGIWGYERRKEASLKFFLFTQISGLFMLIAILGLYFVHGLNTGEYTFNYFALLDISISKQLGFWFMCGFLIAFLVKLPAFPFHSWLPDAHTHSPTAGSVILAGLMLKTAAYGLLRFVVPIFPEASQTIAPLMMLLGVAGILYGAKLTYAQDDFKRLIAFSSVSHMGFIVIGIFSFNVLAYQGTVMQMVAHGISTSALFVIAGAIKNRIGTRDMDKMGRFWEQMPGMGGITVVFVMASLGLPGLANFIAEFLVLVGVFQVSILWSVLATTGLIASMIYSLVILQKIFYGESHSKHKLKDFSIREYLIMTCFIVAIFWLGLFPQKVITTVKPVIQKIEQQAQIKFDYVEPKTKR